MKKVKTWLIILSIGLVLILCAGAIAGVTNWFTDWSRFGKKQEQAVIPPVIGDGEEIPNDGKVHKLPSAMAFMAEKSGVTLQATVLPENAANKKVDWAVAWKNPSDSWAQGKTASAFVSVTPSTDGSTTATVTCTAAFAVQVEITVTSRDNPEAKANCVVDYVKRPHISFDLFNMFCGEDTAVEVDYYDGKGAVLNPTLLTGTVSPELSDYSAVIAMHPVFIDAWNEMATDFELGEFSEFFKTQVVLAEKYYSGEKLEVSDLFDFTSDLCILTQDIFASSAVRNNFFDCFAAVEQETARRTGVEGSGCATVAFELTSSVTARYGSFSHTATVVKPFGIIASRLPRGVSSVTIGNGTIVV